MKIGKLIDIIKQKELRMNKGKVSITELLSKLVFIPESSFLAIELIQRCLRKVFRLTGKLSDRKIFNY